MKKTIQWKAVEIDPKTRLRICHSKDGRFCVYECLGGTWKVFREDGVCTSVGDIRIRNLKSFKQAKARAELWNTEPPLQSSSNASPITLTCEPAQAAPHYLPSPDLVIGPSTNSGRPWRSSSSVPDAS